MAKVIARVGVCWRQNLYVVRADVNAASFYVDATGLQEVENLLDLIER